MITVTKHKDEKNETYYMWGPFQFAHYNKGWRCLNNGTVCVKPTLKACKAELLRILVNGVVISPEELKALADQCEEYSPKSAVIIRSLRMTKYECECDEEFEATEDDEPDGLYDPVRDDYEADRAADAYEDRLTSNHNF